MSQTNNLQPLVTFLPPGGGRPPKNTNIDCSECLKGKVWTPVERKREDVIYYDIRKAHQPILPTLVPHFAFGAFGTDYN